VRAYAHAEECPPCAAALAEGERLLALLEDVPAPPPSAESLAVARAKVLAEFDAPDELAARRTHPVFALVAVLVSAVFAWLDARGGGLAVSVGVECAALELGAAAGAVAIAFVASRRGYSALPSAAAVAAWGAVAGQAYLHFRCPAAHDAPHLFVFHVGAVAVAALIGALALPKWSPAT